MNNGMPIILWHKKVRSTNSTARQHALHGAAEWTAVISETQTAGRGRKNRRWAAGKGGLYISIVLYPRDASHLQLLTFGGALAIADTIRTISGKKADIKWPNDVLLGGRKICGILTEAIHGDKITAILGIGLNLNQKAFPEAIRRKATSLFLETGQRQDIPTTAKILLGKMDKYYSLYQKGKFSAIREKWTDACAMMKQEVSITSRGHRIAGIAIGITEDGKLILRDASGKLHHLFEGEASVS